MIDTSLLPYAIAILLVAAVATLLAVGAITLVVREGIAARRVPVAVRALRADGGTTFHRAA